VIYRKCVTIKICLTAVSPSKLYFFNEPKLQGRHVRNLRVNLD